MQKFEQQVSTRETPQREAIPFTKTPQLPNSAGGFVWEADPWTKLDRFLILGTEKGTYYIGEPQLTRENAGNVEQLIRADGPRVVARVLEISSAGRAPKNDPALFVLAMCFGLGDLATKQRAFDALQEIARTGTHMMHFIRYVEAFRGWGRLLKVAVQRWFNDKGAGDLAYQLLKYQSRDGWSQRDLLRLAHPKPASAAHSWLYGLTVGKDPLAEPVEISIDLVGAVHELHTPIAKARACELIRQQRIPRECVPTQLLTDPEVWDALLEAMPYNALVRNLGNLSKCGLLTQLSEAESRVLERLANPIALKKSRIHPIALLSALKVYGQGHGVKGSGKWEPVPRVLDALDAAFYESFGNVQPAGKQILLALDVSGSMSSPLVGLDFLSCREGTAAMAMVTARTEPKWGIVAFSHELVPVGMTPRARLDDVVRGIESLDFGRTDCSLPMIWAIQRKIQVDAFVVYTDNETWYGAIHPAQALRKYREKSGLAAKLVVVGMTANPFTIADPDDAGMMDVVGFDAAAPAVIADFARE